MIATFIVLTTVALITPQVLPGVKVKGISSALLIALIFVLLNLLIGWFLHLILGLLAWPFVLITFGLFSVIVTSVVNMLLLKLTESILESFEVKGWGPAFWMGLFFAVGAQLAKILS